MMRYLVGICPIVVVASAGAAEIRAPEPGFDYISVQLASGDARALEGLYARHAGLPYLRIERRGVVHVLRAGFWASARDARAAIAGRGLENPLIRTAAYKPEEIVRSNWGSDLATAARPASAASAAPAMLPVAFIASDIGASVEPKLTMSDDTMVIAALAERMPTPITTLPKPPAPPPDAPRQITPVTVNDKEELRPFDQNDFLLAFDIFAGAGDLKRAFRVAEKAVASVPEDMEWRLKLARVAEWTQRPQVAWTQREYLFRHGDRSDETLTAILRLTPIAPNLETVLAVWELKADRAPLTEAQWNDLQQLFDVAAKPRQGSQYFEAQYRRRHDPNLLARAALLADNAGDDERAYKLYLERLDLKPFRVDLALRAVVFLLRHDRNREAFALMEAHRSEVPQEATEYWRVLAQTSWELSELGTAEQAYRNFLTSKQATVAEWSRLIALVRQRNPGEAAQLSMEVYRRYGNLDYLILALTIRTDANDISSQARIFASLSADERAIAEKDNRFLVLRAQYYQLAGNPDKAWADFRVALSRASNDTEVTVPALWFLIDTRRTNELQALLTRLAPQAGENTSYWLPYAAAYHALDRYREAIFWYRKEIARRPDDALMLLNYADALDRYQVTGMADRVRQHVWLRLREQQPKLAEGELKPPFDQNPDLLAFVRLALLNQPGDPALAIVRDVAAKLRGLPTARGDDRETRTLILSWAVATEQFHNARSWMWLRYARSSAARIAAAQDDFNPNTVADQRGAPPLWAEAQTALQLNDTQNMDRLLMRQANGLPIYNRYDTAYALEHWQQALDIAFHGMEKNEVDEELHDRFRQHAPLYANYMQAQFTRDAFGDLDSRSQQYEARWSPFRKLQLRVGFSRAGQSSGNEDFGPFTPSSERLAYASFRWLGGEETNTEFDVFRRREATALTGFRLNQTLRMSARLSLDGTIEHRGNATESIPLRIAGYTDNVRVGVNYTISKREYVRLSGQLDRFYTQYEDYLGRASRVDFDAGYRIRTEYPDFRVRFFAARQVVDRNGSVSASTLARLPASIRDQVSNGDLNAVQYFVPDGSTTTGLCLGAGENLAGANLQEVYTRAWRPFFEACQQHNSINGAGYIGLIGIAGSVIGPDHLSLRLETSRGGTGAGSLARTLALRYRYYF